MFSVWEVHQEIVPMLLVFFALKEFLQICTIQGKEDKNHRDDFLMHFPHGEHRANYFTTYRKGDWKLIYYYNPETTGIPTWKLYNLKDDPYETSELSAKYPEKTASMIELMKNRLTEENALYPITENK